MLKHGSRDAPQVVNVRAERTVDELGHEQPKLGGVTHRDLEQDRERFRSKLAECTRGKSDKEAGDFVYLERWRIILLQRPQLTLWHLSIPRSYRPESSPRVTRMTIANLDKEVHNEEAQVWKRATISLSLCNRFINRA